jgi:hypothetical protein
VAICCEHGNERYSLEYFNYLTKGDTNNTAGMPTQIKILLPVGTGIKFLAYI